MKKILMIACMTGFTVLVNGQVVKRLIDRTKGKLERKAGDKIEEAIDKTVDGKKPGDKTGKSDSTINGSSKEKKTSSDQNSGTNSNSGGSSPNETAGSTSLEAYSKYDFVPGEKVISIENFANDAVGDFPARWNTNSTGEVVTLNGREGKWLKLNRKGAYHLEPLTSFPENFTLEFDIAVNNDFSYYSSEIYLTITNLLKPEDFVNYDWFPRWQGQHSVRLALHPIDAGNQRSTTKIMATTDGNFTINNEVQVNNWNAIKNNFAHVSIWRQKQRVRVYINQEKVWDIPRLFSATATYNALVIATGNFHQGQDYYVLNNFRMAVGAADTRNKLIEEGRFVTRGILFDVNSATIKPESYGTLKDIANVLKENPDVKVWVIGHTDADGDDKKNMDLSKRRAESVRATLQKEFGIDASRIEVDGKGESEPVDKNDTPEGKANNRRVEFIKI